LDPGAFQAPRTRQALELLEDWGQELPTLVVLEAVDSFAGLSFRNLRGVAVVSVESVGVTDLVGAASLLLSEGALDALAARAAPATRDVEKAGA
jgi:ribosomal protein L4